jgi:hypothetical protein
VARTAEQETARDGEPRSAMARKLLRQAQYFAARSANATTPAQRMLVAFDQLRSTLEMVPRRQADRIADQVASLINAILEEIDLTEERGR